ncbi:hypothetical protein ACWD4L_41965 [Streptomyces sp. NPDC002596]
MSGQLRWRESISSNDEGGARAEAAARPPAPRMFGSVLGGQG